MKGKYITIKILLACLSKKPAIKKDIHEQLKETIAEHRKIMRQLDSFLLVAEDGNGYAQLSEAA